MEPPTALHETESWLGSAQKAIANQDIDSFVSLFHDDGWWRDILVIDFDMNSLRKSEIKTYLAHLKLPLPKISNLAVERPHEAKLVSMGPGIDWLQAFIQFETPDCRGNGMLRLMKDANGSWKAFTFFTQLWEVKGHEEFAFDRRPLGTDHGQHPGRRNWLDGRKEKASFESKDPTVLIVGAGHNGLMLAARLGALGIDTLVLDKTSRIGDCWRKRYHSLVLHDPVYADHLALLPYPPNWPVYSPKDKLANWFETYAETMELNVWLESTVDPGATYDPSTGHWTVDVVRAGKGKRTMKPRHLVLATGFSGEPKMPTFPMDEFKGDVHHSSKHPGGEQWKGKKAVVVGCCNSGHDIAADFYEQGADVTIVQRSQTFIMSSKHGIPALLKGFYEEGGPPLHDADIMVMSIPIDLMAQFHEGANTQIEEQDKDIRQRLEKVGFKLNRYPHGMLIKYFRDGGGYYIDVGCSALIADGKVKIKQGKEITKLTQNGVRFEDGVELPADVVVCATGYSSMRDTVRSVIGAHLADRLGPVWGKDKQGEIPGPWRLCGQPAFWLQCGNMFQGRCYSKVVALQIHLQELGLADKNFEGRLDKADKDPRF